MKNYIKSKKSTFMLAFLIISVISGIDLGFCIYYDQEPLYGYRANQNLCLFILALWINLDADDHRYVFKPFDPGLMLYFFWPIYIPYYLLRTRGIRGFLMLLGIILLFCCGWLTPVAILLVQHGLGSGAD